MALPRFLGPDQADPKAFIRSFCADHKRWNDYCLKWSENNEQSWKNENLDGLSKLYAQFLRPFMPEGAKLQAIAFGTDSTFDPDRIAFGKVEVAGSRIEQYFTTRSSISGIRELNYAVLEQCNANKFLLHQIYWICPDLENYPGEDPFLPSL